MTLSNETRAEIELALGSAERLKEGHGAHGSDASLWYINEVVDRLRRLLQQETSGPSDTERLKAIASGEWDVRCDHHCGGFVILHRQKELGRGDLLEQAIDDAMSAQPQ